MSVPNQEPPRRQLPQSGRAALGTISPAGGVTVLVEHADDDNALALHDEIDRMGKATRECTVNARHDRQRSGPRPRRANGQRFEDAATW